MSNEDNWRQSPDAEDYFLRQQKKLAVADRRPVTRRASDLVGPGIGANTVRLDDYNDLLASFNGYYSSEPGAGNAPTPDEAFVGYTVSDATLGGRQEFVGLSTNLEYSRTFVRSPVDPEAIAWGRWSERRRIAATARTTGEIDTDTLPSGAAMLTAPSLAVIGQAGVYERTATAIKILRSGVYTGHVQVGDRLGTTTLDTLALYLPAGSTSEPSIQLNVPLGPTVHIPFTCWADDGAQGFSVLAVHSEAQPRSVWWRFSCTRVGDAN